MGFDEVSSSPIILDGFYMLSHEPMYVSMNNPTVNIYAHVHGCSSYKDISERSFCVSVERKMINYHPIKFTKIISEIQKCNKNKEEINQ